MKTVLAAAILSGVLMGCSSADDCNEIAPIVPTPTNQFITLESTQAKVAARPDAFVNVEFVDDKAVETTQIVKDSTVLDLKRVGKYTLVRVQDQTGQHIYIAKGNGSKFVKLRTGVADSTQFDYVFFPHTLHNETNTVVVFDQYDQSKVSRYDGDLNPIDSFTLRSNDTIAVATNNPPTIHAEHMTLSVYANMNFERQVFKYDGERHMGWRLENGNMVLGIAKDGDIVYAIQNAMGWRIAAIGPDSIVENLGSVTNQNVSHDDIMKSTAQGRFVSLSGNTIDVQEKIIFAERTCTFKPNASWMRVSATDDYFICPVDVATTNMTQTYESYNPFNGERMYIHLDRPAEPIRHSPQSVTFRYSDFGTVLYNVDGTQSEAVNATDIVK